MPSPPLALVASDGVRRKGQLPEERNMAGRELKKPSELPLPFEGL